MQQCDSGLIVISKDLAVVRDQFNPPLCKVVDNLDRSYIYLHLPVLAVPFPLLGAQVEPVGVCAQDVEEHVADGAAQI